MKILYFGNYYFKEDRAAIDAVSRIKDKLNLDFIYCRTPESILDYMEDDIVVLDVAKNIENVSEVNIDDLETKGLNTLHDFDIAFFLKVLKKIGKRTKVKIIAIPDKNCDKELVEKLKQIST